jgi:hypothetical protein
MLYQTKETIMTPEQEKFIAVLTALYPEGIPVEKYSTIILAADLAEKGYLASEQQQIEIEASDECYPPPAMPAVKLCRKCNKLLTLSYFYKNANSQDGHRSICKNCKPHRGRPKTKQPTSAEINAVRAKAKR